jgi:ATP-dependent DNA helicase RecQ
VCQGANRQFEVVEPSAVAAGRTRSVHARRDTSAAPRASRDVVELEGPAVARFDALREWRSTTAREAQVPAYVVFSDRTLRDIATVAPQRLHDLSRIAGIGPAKLERYGESVLEVLRAVG